jgi:hypothetical protein
MRGKKPNLGTAKEMEQRSIKMAGGHMPRCTVPTRARRPKI